MLHPAVPSGCGAGSVRAPPEAEGGSGSDPVFVVNVLACIAAQDNVVSYLGMMVERLACQTFILPNHPDIAGLIPLIS